VTGLDRVVGGNARRQEAKWSRRSFWAWHVNRSAGSGPYYMGFAASRIMRFHLASRNEHRHE
jgi:hypothetical protein